MSDKIIAHSKYNITSFSEQTLEEYKDTLEIFLYQRDLHTLRDFLFTPRGRFYIKYKKVKENIERNVELYDYQNDSPISEFISQFEDTCFYCYVRSMNWFDECLESPLIHASDFNCGAYISNHTYNHIDNSFAFKIMYGRSCEYFTGKIQKVINKKLTTNELQDGFWQITKNKITEITFNKHTRDVNGNINGTIELYKLNDTKSFFSIAIYGLQSYLYKLSKLHLF